MAPKGTYIGSDHSFINVRRAIDDECDMVIALDQQSNPSCWTSRAMKEAFGNTTNIIFVSELEATVTGFLICNKSCDEAEILSVCVGEQWRQCGIGNALLIAMKCYLETHKVQRIFLEVRTNNAPAIHLYLRHGFKAIATRRRYYRDGEDARVMLFEFENAPF